MQANLRHSTVNIICTTLEPIAICPITIRPSLRPFLRESDLGGGLRQIFASLGRVYGLVSSSRIYLVDRFALMQSIRSSAGGQRLHNDLSSERQNWSRNLCHPGSLFREAEERDVIDFFNPSRSKTNLVLKVRFIDNKPSRQATYLGKEQSTRP